MRLPRRSSDIANQALQLRASDIDRLRPEIGSADEATAMAAVLAYNIRLLREAGVTAFHHQLCHECGLSSFAGQDNKTHICGYCGHGPFGLGWCSHVRCDNKAVRADQADRIDGPGPDTWWLIDVVKRGGTSQLYCGTCVCQIPRFMNHSQSQLLDPNPNSWSGESCDGCGKALVIAQPDESAQAVTVGASQQ